MKKAKRNETIKRVVAILCASMVALALIMSLVAPVLAATQQQIDDAKQKTKDAEQNLKNAEAKKKSILDEYNSLDSEISNTEIEIGQLENQIVQTENDIRLKEEELKKAEEDYILYKDLFLTRSRVMYENGDLKYLEILFGAKDFSDFLAKAEMISQLLEYDKKILAQLNDIIVSIANAKKDLEDILKRQEENLANLESRKASLNKVLEQKQALLNEAINDVEKYKLIHEAAEAAEEQMIKDNQESFQRTSYPVEYSGGKFMWPVPGSSRITSYYGMRIHPVYKTKKFHSGIDVGAGYGLDIVAASDGVVTLSTTNGGYGKCIVINHGSGITTLYGHCSSLLVSKGQKVTKGQVIGKVGSTGVSTGPHLHFEVRVNGSTTDPLSYVR